MAEASAHRRLEDVLDRLVRPPRRRQALVAGALLRGSELVRGVPGGPEEPSDDASVFEIGSITKVFTGILLAAGADRGLVELDDPLRALLPSSARLPAEGPEITLPSSPRTPPGCRECRRACRRSCSASGAGSVPGAPRPDELFAALASTRLRNAPGRRYRYSNLGAALLGHALARRAEASWPELVQTVVCEPLGLLGTSAAVPPAERARPPRFPPGASRASVGVPGAGPGGGASLHCEGHGQLPAREPRRAAGGRGAPADAGARAALRLGRPPAGRPRLAHPPLARLTASRGALTRAGQPGDGLAHGLTLGFASFAGFVPAAGAGVVVLASRFRSVTGLGVRILRELSAVPSGR